MSHPSRSVRTAVIGIAIALGATGCAQACAFGSMACEASRKGGDGDDIDPPEVVTGIEVQGLSGDVMMIRWQAQDVAQGYLVERRLEGADSWREVGDVGYMTTTFTDAGLEPSTAYEYAVTAYNFAGEAERSDHHAGSTLAARDGAWEIWPVKPGLDDAEDWGAGVRAALDPSGKLHIVFAHGLFESSSGFWCHDGIWHATWDAGVESLTEISTGGCVADPGISSLAFDGEGRLHVLAAGADTGRMTHMVLDGDVWTTSSVETAVPDQEVTATDLAADPSGRLHACVASGTQVQHAALDADLWTFEVIATGDDHPACAVAVDSADRAHVVWHHEPDAALEPHSLVYSVLEGTWSAPENIVASGEAGQHPDIALDPSGTPHVTFNGGDGSPLRLATRDEDAWTVTTVLDDAAGGRTAVAIDASGAPWVADAGHLLAYDGEAWQAEDPARIGTLGGATDIVPAADGRLLLASHDPDGRLGTGLPALLVLVRDPAAEGWIPEQPVLPELPGESLGVTPRIALDADDDVHMTWGRDASTDRFVYGHRRAGGWRVWQSPDIESTLPASALAVTPEGQPHVFYHLGGLQHLFHVSWEWFEESVDPFAVLDDEDPALAAAVAPDGSVHVVWVDASLGEIRWATDARSWAPETVVSDGLHPSLALDADSRPHIAYHDPSTGTLRHAVRDVTWTVEVVDDASPTGWTPHIALDPGGRPAIAYCGLLPSTTEDPEPFGLLLATLDGMTWTSVTLLDDGCDHPVLAYDADGLPHVVYHSTHAQMVRQLHHDGAGWHLEVVGDMDAEFVARFDAALDAGGEVHVALAPLASGDSVVVHMLKHP